MRAWLDESARVLFVAHDGELRVVHGHADQRPSRTTPAVPLVTASSVVDGIRAELRGLPKTPATRRALRQVLDRAAGLGGT